MDYCANRKWSLCHLCWCNFLDNSSDVEIQLYQTSCALIDLYTQISSVTCCRHLSPRNKPTHPEQCWDGLLEGVLFIGGFHWILLLWSYFVSFWTHWPQMNVKRTTSSLYHCQLQTQFAVIDQMVPTFYRSLSGWWHWFHIKTNQHKQKSSCLTRAKLSVSVLVLRHEVFCPLVFSWDRLMGVQTPSALWQWKSWML